MRRSEARAKVVRLAECLEDPAADSTEWAWITEVDFEDAADARLALEEAIVLARKLAARLADVEGGGRDRLEVLREVARPTRLEAFDDALDGLGLDPGERGDGNASH